VGMQKQKQYDEGIQKIQTNIDDVAGLDVANDADKAYLQSKLNQLGSDLRIVAAGDFSNFQLVNSVNGMTNQIVRDRNVQNAVQSTAHLREEQQRKEKAIQEGKSSPENEYVFNNQVGKYLQSTKPGESFNGQYIEYKDVDKKLRDLASKLKEVDSSIDNPFMRDSATGKTLYYDSKGNVSTDPSKGQPKYDTVMLTTTVKGISAEKILNNFYDSLDETDKRQLNITAQYHYRSATPITFQNDIIKTYNEKKRIYSDAIVDASVKLATEDLTPQQKSILQTEINKAKGLLYDGGFDKQMNEDLAGVDTEAEADAYKYKIYTQKYLTNLSKDLANESISTKYSDNPGFKAIMDQKKFQFDIEKEKQAQKRFQLEFGLKQRSQNFEEYKFQMEQEAKAKGEKIIVLPGDIRTDIKAPSLFDIEANVDALKNDKTRLNNQYGKLLFPGLKPEEAQKSLNDLVTKYLANPNSIKDNKQREYLEKVTSYNTQIADGNNLWRGAVNATKQYDAEIAAIIGSQKGVMNSKTGKTMYDATTMYKMYNDAANNYLRKEYKEGKTMAGLGSTGGYTITKVDKSFLDKHKGTKNYGLALAIYNGYNNNRMSGDESVIYNQLKKITTAVSPRVDQKFKEQAQKQSEFIAKNSPEFQTQKGTLNIEDKPTASAINQFITRKNEQYETYGALDQQRPDDFDPSETKKLREGKSTGYTIVKNYDGSGTVIVSDGVTTQRIPATREELTAYFPQTAQTSPLNDIKKIVSFSEKKTTNVAGNKDPYNARIQGFDPLLPMISSTAFAPKVRVDVEGSGDNNGGANDKFQVRLYYNSSQGWISDVVNQRGYVNEAGLQTILNNIGPLTIDKLLKNNNIK
jgi:hypothetical protein